MCGVWQRQEPTGVDITGQQEQGQKQASVIGAVMQEVGAALIVCVCLSVNLCLWLWWWFQWSVLTQRRCCCCHQAAEGSRA